MSEANKSEAERCLQIALKYAAANNFEKAKRFLKKSDDMYPTDRAKALLVEMELRAQKATENPPTDTGAHTHHSTTAHRRHTKDSAKVKTPPPRRASIPSPPREFTPEQAAAVRRIKQCRGYYEILSVEKGANDAQIKKAYRKLALTFHPDKNQAPGADEAFKSISKAFQVLSDKSLRQQYDLYGEEGAQRAQQQGARGGGMQGAYGQAFTPEEIFQMFFNGVRPEDLRRGGGGARRTHQQPGFRTFQFGGQQAQGHSNGSGISFMHILPFVLMFLLSMLSGGSDIKPFDLRQTSDHPLPRRTTTREVPYFVRRNFNQEFQGKPRDLSRMEETVEKEWLIKTQNHCNSENYNMKRNLDAAKYYNDAKRIERVMNTRKPYCEQLKAFKDGNLGEYLNGAKEKVRSVPR